MSAYMRMNLNQMVLSNQFYQNLTTRAYYELVYSYLKAAEIYYPEFRKWYTEKVIPELFTSNRELIVENRNDDIAGIAIVKKEENKLCTLRITEDFQNKGIGLKLFEKSFESLNTGKPFLTVSEEKLVEFEKIFKYYGFKMTSIHKDLYRKGKKEYFFNEM